MKLLILCDLFPPAFGPRMGYLCKYLKRSDWEPVVLTEAIGDTTFAHLSGVCEVHALPYYPQGKGLGASLKRMLLFALDILFGYKDYRMYKEARKLVERHDFRLILCSTYRCFPLRAAAKAARRYNLPWVADLRDIIEQYPGYEFISRPLPRWLLKAVAPVFRRTDLAKRNRSLRRANCVTTVSPWHVETLRPHNPDTRLIYNGYDPEIFFPQHTPAPQFLITYTGRLFTVALGNPCPLFEALQELRREGFLNPSVCRVCWYTDEASRAVVANLARRLEVEDFMDYKGYAPASEVPAILNRSSVLLLLTNKSEGDGPKGIITTKLFEYMAVEKPILCVRSDESLLAELLRTTRSGYAAANSATAASFLRHYYQQWEAHRSTSAAPDREQTANFSREKQAGEFVCIFNQLTIGN